MQLAPRETDLQTVAAIWGEPQRSQEIDAAWEEYQAGCRLAAGLTGAEWRRQERRNDWLFEEYLRLRDAN